MTSKSPQLSTRKAYEFKHRIMNQDRIEHSPDQGSIQAEDARLNMELKRNLESLPMVGLHGSMPSSPPDRKKLKTITDLPTQVQLDQQRLHPSTTKPHEIYGNQFTNHARRASAGEEPKY